MKNTFTFLLYILGCTCLSAQNLNFSDTKFKKLLLTSNSTNSIAIDKNNNSIIIDENNDGEISLEEANRIKILNVRQDPNFKYKNPNELDHLKEVNEDYYNEHLPEDVHDLLLFKNLEEIYIHDTKSINLHFKDNDKIRIVKFLVDFPLVRVDRNLIFENCTAITNLRDVLALGTAFSSVTSNYSFINCTNVIPNDLELQNTFRELTIINTPVNSLSVRIVDSLTSFYSTKLTVKNVPTLKSVIIGRLVTLPYLDLANNENLEELIFVPSNDNRSATRETKFLNLKGNHNLKKIIGLNYETIDFSNDGLNNLEELDIALLNARKYNSNGLFIVFGNTKSVNLKGLPKLKKFIAFNQIFDSIDFSDNPLLEEIDLTNTIINFKSLDLSNFNHLKNVKINLITNPNSLDRYPSKLSNLNVNNNPSLEKLEFTNNPIRYFELNNNEKIENILFSNYLHSSVILDENTTFLITNNPKLNAINFSRHQFDSLDLSKNKSLKNIFFRNNNIDMNLLNIRNNNTENVDLKQLMKFRINTICVNDIDVENMQIKFPESNIITTCNDKETLSINNLKKDDVITIYPNPIQDNLTIKSSTEIKFIEIYSIAAERVLYKTVNSKTYNTSLVHLKPGNYILKINTNNEVQIKKIIKK